ncbi:MAG: cupin domain-containing protein [Patescibacteria group bacterium]
MNIFKFAAKDKTEVQHNCHDGTGSILFREVFGKSDFVSKLNHVHETIIHPHSTIGYHKNTGNEEIYYIISGEGVMKIDDEEHMVRPGDATIVHGGSSHGLQNNSDKEMKILVIECNYN